MPKQSSDFVLSSLRNRILLAVAALVVFNLIFGLAGYLAVSFIISEPVYAVVSSVAAMTVATAVFGWWLSNEILRPIEAVSLLARTLERSPSASLPKTTGASETDELLSSLHRNSQQLQNLIGLMDDVASGKTDAAMAPLQNPDRLSVSFQKLVSKVIESIKAKQQLDALAGSVSRLRNDVSGVRSGDLSVQFHGDLWQVSEIVDAFKYVLGGLAGVVRHVSLHAASAKDTAEDAKAIIKKVIEAENGHAERLNRAASLISESPQRFVELTDQLGSAVHDISSSLTTGGAGSEAQVETVNRLRGIVGESRKQIEQMRERANAIPQIARRTDEIARRSNIIALNTSIQGGSAGSGSLLADEVAALSLRTEAVHKDMIAINESLISDLLKLDVSIGSIALEVPQIATVASHQSNTLGEVENNVRKLDAIHSSLKTYLSERLVENEAVIKILTTHFQGVDRPAQLKASEQNLESIINSAEVMREAVGGFDSPQITDSRQIPASIQPAENLSSLDDVQSSVE